MSDNLTDIKNSVKNIDDKITNLTQNGGSISEMEKALGTISGHTKTIDGIKTDTKNTADGINQIMSKLDALDTIQKWTKTQSGNSKNGRANNGGVKGTIDSKIDSLVNYQKEIHGFTNTIATNTDNISTNTREAADYLKALKEHIVDGGASVTTTAAPKAVGNGKEFNEKGISSIDSNVKKIVSIMETMKATALADQDDELKQLLINNAKGKEQDDADRRKYNEISKKDRKERTKAEKEFLKDYRRKEKNKKKEEEKLNKKSGSMPEAAKIGVDIAKSIISEKPSVSKIADVGISAVSQASPVVGTILGLLKSVIELGSKQDRATSEFARTVGGNRQGKTNAGDTVREMIRTAPAGRGYTADAAYSAMTEIAEARGRTTERMSADALRSAIDLKRFGIGAEAVNNFDTFGKSLEQTDKYFSRLYSEVSKKGLSFKNVSKAVNDNLKMAQSHTFANGLRGFEEMAEKSTQLKYNMQQVFQFADKVSEIEGAISTAANLSVLGGEFAQFSNPMQLLYEGLNDTEALNDRIVNMFSGKAYWNQEKGQMDMNALERERLKEAAKAAGLDPNEMLNMAYNQGRINRVSSQIRPGVSKDTAEYIKNIAELNGKGEAVVSLNGKEKLVSNLTDKDKEMLEKESRAKDRGETAKLGDIWNTTMSIGEKLDNLLSYLQEQLGRWVFGLFNKFARYENNRMNIAQGSGSEELQKKRLQYYNIHASEHNGFWGGRKRWARDVVSKMTDSELDAELSKNKQGESPNGLPVVSNMPGTNGFANGPSHWEGGIKATYRGQPWEIEGSEFLVNKNSSMKYRKELSQIQNGTFNPYSYANDAIKNNMDKHYMYQPVTPVATGPVAPNVQNAPNAVNGTIKVDIPHTITINIAGGNKIGDYDISGIVSKYVDAFMQEAIKRRDFAGFNKEEFYNKSGVIGL